MFHVQLLQALDVVNENPSCHPLVQLLQSLDGVNENPSCHPLVGLVVREVEAVMVVQAVHVPALSALASSA